MKSRFRAVYIFEIIFIGILTILLNAPAYAGAGTTLGTDMTLAPAGIIFSDDFESYAQGVFPSSGGWQLKFNGEGSSYQYVDTAHSVSGTKALHLVGSYCWSADAYHDVTLPSSVKLEANVFASQVVGCGCSPILGSINLNDPNLGTWGTAYGSVSFNCDGNIYAQQKNDQSSKILLRPYVAQRWYHIESYINLETKTYDVYIDGILYGTALNILDAGTPTGAKVQAGHGSYPTFWFDDVKISTWLPHATTKSASKVTRTSATLNGGVNPYGLETTYYFQWGLTTAYGNTTASQSAGNGTSAVAVSANLNNLTPNATYHYRLVATNSAGTGYGSDMSFIATNSSLVDFNGDGKTDLLWQHKTSGGLYVWYMTGVNYTGGNWILSSVDSNWQVIGTGDFNLDGKTDLLWQHKPTGALYAWYMTGVSFNGGDWVVTSFDTNWQVIATGDFNGDGKPDLLWQYKPNGALYVWYMNGVNLTGGDWVVTSFDTNWQVVGIGDFNGDGEPDLLWQHKPTGGLYVWYMNGANHTGGDWILYSVDSNWEVIGTGDFNGDGKTDLLWHYKPTGGLYVWYMNGVSFNGGDWIVTSFDTNWQVVAP
jgi:hypothetical protein